MVAVPVRELAAGFDATVRPTVPLPVPLAPLATVIHDAALDALHAHPAPLVTETLADWPAAGALLEAGVIAYVHAAAPCVTV